MNYAEENAAQMGDGNDAMMMEDQQNEMMDGGYGRGRTRRSGLMG